MSDEDRQDNHVSHPRIDSYAEQEAQIGAELREAAVKKMQPQEPAREDFPRRLELRNHPEGLLIVTERAEQLFTPADEGAHIAAWNSQVHPAWSKSSIKGRC